MSEFLLKTAPIVGKMIQLQLDWQRRVCILQAALVFHFIPAVTTALTLVNVYPGGCIWEWLIGLGQRPTDPRGYLHAVEGSTRRAPLTVQAATSPTAAVSLGGSVMSSSGTGTVSYCGVCPPSTSHMCTPMGSVFAPVPGPVFAPVHSSVSVPPQTNINHVLSHHNAVTSASHQVSSLNGPVSGPVFLSSSVGLDVLFLSHDWLSNVLGDDSCLHTHLVNHGLSADGTSAFDARQSLAFHLMTGIALGVSVGPEADAELLRSELLNNLSARRASLMREQSVSHPLNSIFEPIETLPKARLRSLAALHGLDIHSPTVHDGRQTLAMHLAGGLCRIHRSGFRHLGCSSLLALSEEQNSHSPIPRMDLVSSANVDFEMAQINVLSSVVKTLSKRPLRRILQMHRVDYSPSDGTAALRKHLKAYLKCLRLGKKKDSLNLKGKRREQELDMYIALQLANLGAGCQKEVLGGGISQCNIGRYTRNIFKDQRRLRVKDIDIHLLRRPDFAATDPPDLISENSDNEDGDVEMPDVIPATNAAGSNEDTNNMNAEEDSIAPLPWLDPDCIAPPMPCDEPMPFDPDVRQAIPIAFNSKNIKIFFEVLESTGSAITGSAVPRVLAPPIGDVEEWFPNNFNVYPPLGHIAPWEAFFSWIGLPPCAIQPGISAPYATVTKSHLECESRVPNRRILLSESINSCVLTPATASATTMGISWTSTALSNLGGVQLSQRASICRIEGLNALFLPWAGVNHVVGTVRPSGVDCKDCVGSEFSPGAASTGDMQDNGSVGAIYTEVCDGIPRHSGAEFIPHHHIVPKVDQNHTSFLPRRLLSTHHFRAHGWAADVVFAGDFSRSKAGREDKERFGKAVVGCTVRLWVPLRTYVHAARTVVRTKVMAPNRSLLWLQTVDPAHMASV
ncbi:hypothetical protein B0H14DRAFT_3760377 [Mycena olivaceomarginata]|nr:hypothetical protein B0H14DRAFT_3760377 [Mycena olivaceomarginata]